MGVCFKRTKEKVCFFCFYGCSRLTTSILSMEKDRVLSGKKEKEESNTVFSFSPFLKSPSSSHELVYIHGSLHTHLYVEFKPSIQPPFSLSPFPFHSSFFKPFLC